MFRLLWALIAVAAAYGTEKYNNVTPPEDAQIQVLNFKAPPVLNIFDSGISHKNFKIIEDITFFNELESCRAKYPNINSTLFYKHLYCSLVQEGYTTSTGISCKMTESLIKKIQKRLSDFIMFKNLIENNTTCEKNSFRKKRSSLDSDLLPGAGLIEDKKKDSDLSYIYLGPTRFPLTTELYNRVWKVNENLGVLKRTVHNAKNTTEKSKKTKSKTKTSKRPKISKAPSHKPIKLSPKNILGLMNFWKFRMVREDKKTGDFLNATLFAKDLGSMNEKTSDPYGEIQGNPVFYYKLFEIFFNILGRFNKYIQDQTNSTMVAGGNTTSDDATEQNKVNLEVMEIEEKEMKKEEDEKNIDMREENRKPRSLNSVNNNYKTKAPVLYFTRKLGRRFKGSIMHPKSVL